MIRFSLLPYQSFNDEEDLTNEEFLNRIQEPIDGEMIAVSIIPYDLYGPPKIDHQI